MTTAALSFSFAQEPLAPLDPQNVLVIEPDAFDDSGDMLGQNAFRIDFIDPNEDVYYAAILYNTYAPVDAVGDYANQQLEAVLDDGQALLDLLQQNEGVDLRIRVAQVESTFPWQWLLDDVSLVVDVVY